MLSIWEGKRTMKKIPSLGLLALLTLAFAGQPLLVEASSRQGSGQSAVCAPGSSLEPRDGQNVACAEPIILQLELLEMEFHLGVFYSVVCMPVSREIDPCAEDAYELLETHDVPSRIVAEIGRRADQRLRGDIRATMERVYGLALRSNFDLWLGGEEWWRTGANTNMPDGVSPTGNASAWAPMRSSRVERVNGRQAYESQSIGTPVVRESDLFRLAVDTGIVLVVACRNDLETGICPTLENLLFTQFTLLSTLGRYSKKMMDDLLQSEKIVGRLRARIQRKVKEEAGN